MLVANLYLHSDFREMTPNEQYKWNQIKHKFNTIWKANKLLLVSDIWVPLLHEPWLANFKVLSNCLFNNIRLNTSWVCKTKSTKKHIFPLKSTCQSGP